MNIKDVLTWCEEQGFAWHHPRWEADSKDRRCQARVVVPNGWEVSIGCCDIHYCSWRDLDRYDIDIYGETKTADEWFTSPDAEIAIFRPDGSWYIPEGEDGEPGDSWVGGWWMASRIRDVIAYIALMEGGMPTEPPLTYRALRKGDGRVR
jgi:hypothetical protein